MVEKVDRWQTKDGKIFNSEDEARYHEEIILISERLFGWLLCRMEIFDIMNDKHGSKDLRQLARAMVKEREELIEHLHSKEEWDEMNGWSSKKEN